MFFTVVVWWIRLAVLMILYYRVYRTIHQYYLDSSSITGFYPINKNLTIDILELYSIDVFDKIIDGIDHSLILYEEFFGTRIKHNLLLQFPSYSPVVMKFALGTACFPSKKLDNISGIFIIQ